MKTGIVMQIKDKTAVIMDTDGEFIERPARPDWQKGDVVSWKDARRSRNFRIFYAAAACFILFLHSRFGWIPTLHDGNGADQHGHQPKP